MADVREHDRSRAAGHAGRGVVLGDPEALVAGLLGGGGELARFVERTGADELILSGATYDPSARRRSLELTMKAVS